MVLFGFVIAWRFAGSPTLRSPFPLSKKATIEGVVLRPSLFCITTGSLPSSTATQLFVVPKSIPIILLMINIFCLNVHKWNANTKKPLGLCQNGGLYPEMKKNHVSNCQFY
jgi:hypothetical protein